MKPRRVSSVVGRVSKRSSSPSVSCAFPLFALCVALASCADPASGSTGSGSTDTGSTDTGSSADGSSGVTEPTGVGSSGEVGWAMLGGRAEKGPLVLGSTVVASTLMEDGQPSGEAFFGMIEDDLGSFSLALPTGLVAVLTEGFYFDEVTGRISGAPLSLRGTAVVPIGGATSRVNVLTHLRDARALALIAAGDDPETALLQAADECVLALEIGAGVVPAGAFDALELLGAGTLDDAYLLAVSATLVAATEGSAGELQFLLNTLANDLADDGQLDPRVLPLLRAGETAVDAALVLANLEQFALAVGEPWVAPPLAEVLDTDHDGIANAFDNCPTVPNPLQDEVPGCHCGDGLLDAGEGCDGAALGGATCVGEGFDGGMLACTRDCALDLTGCYGCGDDMLDLGETCDGIDLDGQTCIAIGFDGGVLACDPTCSFDTSGCTVCGNGVVEAPEECDNGSLGGQTCVSLGFGGGRLSCAPSCAFDVSGCV